MRHARRPSANVPAATFAEYSPRLWPATNAGCDAARRQHAGRGDADGQDRRLRVLGERQLILRALEASACCDRRCRRRRRRANAASASSNAAARLGKRLGQRLAHADFLRALSGKHEGDHAAHGDRGGGDLLLDARNEIAGREPVRHRDRVAHRLRRRAAVADDGQAGDAEQRRAAVLRVVDPAAEPPERPPRQQVSDLARERAAAARRRAAPPPSRPAPRSSSARRCR